MRTIDEQIKPWGYISPFAKKSLQDRERCDLTVTRKATASQGDDDLAALNQQVAQAQSKPDKALDATNVIIANIRRSMSHAELEDVTSNSVTNDQRAWLRKNRPELAKEIDAALADALAALDGEGAHD